MKMYGIWCQVSGGITGYRAAWLKSKGEQRTFQTLQEAELYAKRLTEDRMHNRYRTADYHYSAREI
jgi:hypothetical protein